MVDLAFEEFFSESCSPILITLSGMYGREMMIDHFLVGIGTSTTHLFLTLTLFIFTLSEKRRDFCVRYSQTEVETLMPLLSLACGFYLLGFFCFVFFKGSTELV